MKKADRQKVFDKYGGRCAYCGCELEKGWHVDHLDPIVRARKRVSGHWSDGYYRGMSEQEIIDKGIKWINEKWVVDGCERPQNECLDNQMPACAPCNILKSSQSLEGFRQSIAQFVNSLNSYTNQYKFAKRYGLIEETGKPVRFYFELLNSDKNPEVSDTTGAK